MADQGYWWCSHCQEEVGSHHVTYQELHTKCGRTVQWINYEAIYHYFKPSGKWYTSGKGVSVPQDGRRVTHASLKKLNGGSMPGITSDGTHFIVVVVDEHSFPRMVPNLEPWR